ncbi:hypothetical protein PsWM33_03682 [Pseudovibrio sp. WM33]|nr:hypothetical protein PsWM33_03682 [Pseudovibrio sp. WM33]
MRVRQTIKRQDLGNDGCESNRFSIVCEKKSAADLMANICSYPMQYYPAANAAGPLCLCSNSSVMWR